MMNRRFLTDANELCRLGVGQLTAGFSSGKFTPLEVAQATLARAEQVQERFNAFSLIDVDAALAMAKESTTRWRSGTPLSSVDGVPTTIKDIVWVKDRAVRYGSRTTSTTPCTQDAPSVKRLRAAGAVLIGLTTTPEFGWKAITDSPLTGVTRNPWNPKMTPGGSSGGAVVAAATGAGVLHIGTDGGGSIRIPSSLTGMVGLKPTFGRVAAYPPSAFGTVAHIGQLVRESTPGTGDFDDMGRGRPPLGARREGVNCLLFVVCCLIDIPLAKCPTRRKIEPTYATTSRRNAASVYQGKRVNLRLTPGAGIAPPRESLRGISASSPDIMGPPPRLSIS